MSLDCEASKFKQWDWHQGNIQFYSQHPKLRNMCSKVRQKPIAHQWLQGKITDYRNVITTC